MTTHTDSYRHLLSPGVIGPMALDNRVVLPAMDMNLCVDGEIEPGDVAHFAARARGGTGLIITGCCSVAYPVGSTSMKEPGLSEDRFIPGLKELADGVHAAGSKLCLQMVHHGKVARIDTISDRPLLVPSEPAGGPDMGALVDNTPEELQKMAAVTEGKQPSFHPADADDIAWLIDKFTSAALRVREAGVDAVEIHCAHGYVLGAFLSRADNKRTDSYGGSLENRARLACEVIAAVKGAVGDDLAVIVRVAGKEFGADDGLDTAEAVAASRLFEAAGADAIHVTGWARNPFANFTDGPLPDRVGAYVGFAEAVKQAVTIPVIAVGRMLPEVAEQAIATGKADYAAMGRQLLADPDLVVKLREGRAAQVRPCINCYVCVQENFWDDVPICAVNPALGEETLLPMPAAKTTKHIVVIGAGPAGLESARLAADRGHRVTVLDQVDRLGGTLWFSSLTTPDNGKLLDWLAGEVERLGVDVRLNTEATPELVRALGPDEIVLATGAVRRRPEVPGGDLPHVQTGDTLRALLTGAGDTSDQKWYLRAMGRVGKATGLTASADRIRTLTRRFLPMGKDVVVIGGSLVGLELAEFLAERGRRVTLLESGGQLGLPMAMPRRWTAVRHAREHGVDLRRGAVVRRITETAVEYELGGEVHNAPASMVVMADGVFAEAPLADALGGIAPVHVVGDAAGVDYIQGAIHSAWRLAPTL